MQSLTQEKIKIVWIKLLPMRAGGEIGEHFQFHSIIVQA